MILDPMRLGKVLAATCDEPQRRALNIMVGRCIDGHLSGGKIFFLGNGGSAAMSDHLAGELVGRFEGSRQAIAALSWPDLASLTAVANDFGWEKTLERWLEAHFRAVDTLFLLSTSGSSRNLLMAASGLKMRGLGHCTFGFLGRDGGDLLPYCREAIVVPSEDTATIQEVHLFLGHELIRLIERGARTRVRSPDRGPYENLDLGRSDP